jgi:two-component system OmpR family sensor kinase
MRLDTLRARVVTWYVGLLAAALLVFGATLYFGVQGYLNTSLQHSLGGEAKAIGSTFLAFEEQKGQAWMAGEITEAYAPELSGRFIRIVRHDGAILYQSGDTRDPIIAASAIPMPDFKRGAASFQFVRQTGSDDLLLYTDPFRSSSGTDYLIQTGSSIAPIEHVLSSLRRIVLVITPLILIAAALGGQFLMKLPLRPLVALSERAEQIGMSKLGERLPVLATHDEMERLALSLNRMIDRLEDALSLNRRFSGDVSHELRTPLTIMRGELEQVLLDPSASESVHDAVASSLEEISRMSKIVESLLAIARLDSGADAIESKPADVSALCRWVVEQLHPLADDKNIALRVDASAVMGLIDAARMKQVLVNLIDNAIKYTQPGGSVELTCFASDGMAVIEVTDTGIGIPQDELPHVFDRFFRADKVRSRASGGVGLGLSIVKAICNAHSGTIAIASTEGVGTVVRIQLPLASAGVDSPVAASVNAVAAQPSAR